MDNIEKSVNKMVGQDVQCALIDNIIGGRQDEFENFVKTQQENQAKINEILGRPYDRLANMVEVSKDEIGTQELEYKNSSYYDCYRSLLTELKESLPQIYSDLMYKYQYNIFNYNDAFLKPLKHNRVISGIGFPVPEKYLNDLMELVQNIFNELHESVPVDDIETIIQLVPVEYAQVGNVVKQLNSYFLNIEFTRKIKEKKIK